MSKTRSEFLQLSVSDLHKADCRDSRNSFMGQVVSREPAKRFGFFRPLLILVRQRVCWSPFIILGELCRLLANKGLQREIFSLLKLRPFDEIIQTNPRLAFKYVVPNYLARSFTVSERVSCFLHHYRRMLALLPENTLRQILQEDITLHEIAKDGSRFAVTIGSPKAPHDKEGELSLGLQVDGKKIFDLSFIIVPGWVVKSEVAEILLITRLQGEKGCNSQIKLVFKKLCEYSPRKLLLAALQGIADAFGIGWIAAACAANQKYYSKRSDAILKHSYDDFFATLGMSTTANGFFFSSTRIEGKHIALFKERQRQLAIERRATRNQIRSACAAFFLGVADRATDFSSSAVNSTPVQGAIESGPTPLSCPTPDHDLTA